MKTITFEANARRLFFVICSMMTLTTSLTLKSSFAATPSDVSGDDLPVISANLSLLDALRVADQDNNQISHALADGASAKSSELKAKSALAPSVSATTYGSTGSEFSIVTSSPGVSPQNVFAVPRRLFADQDLTIMFPLSTGDTLQKRAASATDLAAASQWDLAANMLTAEENVTRAYLNVLLQQSLLSSAQSALTEEQEQVRITQTKVEAGALAPVDLLREQSELASAQISVTQSVTDIELTEVDLKKSIGVSQMSEITLTDTLDSLVLVSPARMQSSLFDAIKTATENRPELAAAHQRIDAARADLRAAKGEFAPQVYALGMADAMAVQGMHGQTGYTVGLTASLPLYDGGERRSDVSGAAAALSLAQAEERNAKGQIESEVSEGWFKLAASGDQIASAQAGLAAAQQGYDLASLRYNSGKSTTADRLDALAALTRARGDLSLATAAAIEERDNLLLVTGLLLH